MVFTPPRRDRSPRWTSSTATAVARGNLYMAHRCGFTARVLTGTLQAHGFATVISRRRDHPYYDLWAAATVAPADEPTLRALAAAHFP